MHSVMINDESLSVRVFDTYRISAQLWIDANSSAFKLLLSFWINRTDGFSISENMQKYIINSCIFNHYVHTFRTIYNFISDTLIKCFPMHNLKMNSHQLFTASNKQTNKQINQWIANENESEKTHA